MSHNITLWLWHSYLVSSMCFYLHQSSRYSNIKNYLLSFFHSNLILSSICQYTFATCFILGQRWYRLPR